MSMASSLLHRHSCSCLLLFSTLLVSITAQSNSTVQIPAQYGYLLPRPFNNSFTRPFVDTSLPPGVERNILTAARNTSFISYDPEFYEILGDNTTIVEIARGNTSFAFEGAVWVPPLNQVWFTAFLDPVPGYLSILDLNSSTVFRPRLTGTGASIPVNPNGAYFFNGLVYLTSFGNTTTSPTIVSINPDNYDTNEIVNSFYGLPLNGPDDVTIAVSQVTGNSCMFYSDFFFGVEGLKGSWPGPQQLPNAVYRFLPEQKSLTLAISPLDVQTPNGLAVNKNSTVLYVSDGPDSAVFGRPYNDSSGSSALYKFDLAGQDGCTPVSKRVVSVARQGFVNGIKVDDYERVWTAEYEGIVVRNPQGKVLGLFNAQEILKNANITDVAPIANFALVHDRLYWLAFNRIYAIKLGQLVKTWY